MVGGSTAVAGALVASGVLGLLAAAPSPAEAPNEAGYWWRLRQDPVLTADPSVPAGGLKVASDPTGAQATSAVRAIVPGGAAVEALVLAAAQSTGTGAAITACPSGGWRAPAAGAAGDWAARPTEAFCGEGVAGVLEGSTWRFPVGELVSGEVLDVVLVPGPGTFAVAFTAPGPDSVEIRAPEERPPVLADPEPELAAPDAPDAPEAAAEPTVTAPFDLPAAIEDLPSSGLAAPIGGTPAESLEQDVQALPAPIRTASRPRGSQPAGGRAPLALLAVAVIGGTWFFRLRSAVTAAAGHPFAAPIGIGESTLTGAGRLLTASTPEGRGATA